MIKLKPDGDTCWTKTYHITDDHTFNTIKSCNDGNFLIAGSSNITVKGIDGLLVKIKPNGDIIWTKIFHKNSKSYFSYSFSAIHPTCDGNYLVAGSTNSTGNYDSSDSWLAKIKSNGDTIWSRTYGSKLKSRFLSIQPSSDGNYLLAGSVVINSTQGSAGWLLKITPDGDTLWSRTFDRAWDERISTIQPTSDGNFMLLCDSYSRQGGSTTFLINLIADQYATKNKLFTYKIPTWSTDTLNFGYVPLKVPSGMTVSAGGTVSWTPNTDSVYMDHAEFIIMNDMGRKDTLTFNIFVNTDLQKQVSARSSPINQVSLKQFEITSAPFSCTIRLSLPPTAVSLSIYDMTGRIVDKIAHSASSSGSYINWPGDISGRSKIPVGRYFSQKQKWVKIQL